MPSPRTLEDRVVAALRAEALIAPARKPIPWPAILPALLLAIAAGALLLMRPAAPPAGQAGELYMLALYSGPAYRPGPPGARAAEYGRWARGRAAAIVDGAEIGARQAVLGPPPRADEALSGYFIVRARGPADAAAIARTMPHLRHGGTIVVRRIGG